MSLALSRKHPERRMWDLILRNRQFIRINLIVTIRKSAVFIQYIAHDWNFFKVIICTFIIKSATKVTHMIDYVHCEYWRRQSAGSFSHNAIDYQARWDSMGGGEWLSRKLHHIGTQWRKQNLKSHFIIKVFILFTLLKNFSILLPNH